uniref:Uncharacterized protein n=1 Tax=Salix viminalis TaxID=40686 RepID=A0A6N2NFA4_SALVM
MWKILVRLHTLQVSFRSTILLKEKNKSNSDLTEIPKSSMRASEDPTEKGDWINHFSSSRGQVCFFKRSNTFLKFMRVIVMQTQFNQRSAEFDIAQRHPHQELIRDRTSTASEFYLRRGNRQEEI